MDRLQAMRVFARVADEGGFAAAARALDMSPPVVTRVVAELEQHLNTRLLHRTTRKVAVTEAGDAYLQRVRSILSDIDDAEAAATASTRDLQGTVHVLAPAAIATYFLAPLIPRWRERHPRLVLDLTTDNVAAGRVDEFDVTFLVVPDDFDGNVVARKLFQGEAIVVASPGYLLRRGAPQQPQDLESHDFLRDTGNGRRGARKLCLKPLSGDVATTEPAGGAAVNQHRRAAAGRARWHRRCSHSALAGAAPPEHRGLGARAARVDSFALHHLCGAAHAAHAAGTHARLS
jgi:DNA-binding transcriptional LysR family regulator